MNPEKIFLQLIVFLVITSTALCAEPSSRQELVQQKRTLELNMAKLRVNLLKNDDDLRRLNEKIMKLQRQLMKKIDNQPEMQFLINKVKKIDKQLKDLK